MQAEEKLPWLDSLRVIATFAVIVLHVSAKALIDGELTLNNTWWIGNIYNSCVRFSVPIFLMITGSLLLPRSYELSDFLKKRLIRIVLPFLFWSVVYIIFHLVTDSWAPRIKIAQGDYLSILHVIKWSVVQLLQGSSFHLWYVYLIIGIYMFIPIIGKWIRNCSEKEIKYFLLIWIVTLFLNEPFFKTLKPAIDLTYFTGFLGYVILGHYLTIKSFCDKKATFSIAMLLIAVGVAVTIVGAYFYASRYPALSNAFYGYLTPNVFVVATGVFMLIKDRIINNSGVINVRNFISKYSYGVYLVHPLVLYFLSQAGISWGLLNPIIGISITAIICLVVSTLVIFVINKLPYGKYISG
jgi:surface polysaccharide O-acyltransferase-like enzyme